MKGWNKGVVTNANNPPDDPSKFLAKGKIMEAYGLFEAWQDCNVHISGLVYWITIGLPEKAVGAAHRMQLRLPYHSGQGF